MISVVDTPAAVLPRPQMTHQQYGNDHLARSVPARACGATSVARGPAMGRPRVLEARDMSSSR